MEKEQCHQEKRVKAKRRGDWCDVSHISFCLFPGCLNLLQRCICVEGLQEKAVTRCVTLACEIF